MLSDIGLEVNPSQLERSSDSCDNFQSVMIATQCILLEVMMIEREDLSIIGNPIDINGCHTGVPKAVELLSAMSDRLHRINRRPLRFLSLPELPFDAATAFQA